MWLTRSESSLSPAIADAACEVTSNLLGAFSDSGQVVGSMNPDGRGASYLDVYKNEIANRATEFGFAAGYRTDFFAYHGEELRRR